MNEAQEISGNPSVDPKLRGAQVEPDTFCQGCGFNLHGQPVFTHPQFDFPICRCPSCDRQQPAALFISASWPSLIRRRRLLIAIWIGICIGLATMLLCFIGAIEMGMVANYTETVYRTSDGRPLVPTWFSNKFQYAIEDTVPPEIRTDVVTLQHTLTLREYSERWSPTVRATPDWQYLMAPACVLGISCFLGGMIIAVSSWHLKNKVLWAMMLPIPVVVVVYVFWRVFAEQAMSINTWAITRFSIVAGIQVLVLAAGLWLGRPLARLIVSMILPPVPRQRLAFLWFVDDKAAPIFARGKTFFLQPDSSGGRRG